MAAVRWEQLEGEDDADFAIFAAMVAGFDVWTLSDRLAAWRPPWMATAACKGYDVAMFFRGGAADEAKAICAGCVVRPECLDFATGHGEVGVWGGASPAERAEERRRARPRRGWSPEV